MYENVTKSVTKFGLFKSYLKIQKTKKKLSSIFIFIRIFFAAGKKIFRDFLRCEYSEENILFWMAVEELKKESNPDVIEEKARFIYEDYISILSPKEVSPNI